MTTTLMKIWIYTWVCIGTIFRFLLHWFLALLYSGRKRVVPPVTDSLLLKSAASLAADIRHGRVKSEDVVKAYCARIREVNPYINAIADERFEAALNEAQKVDEFIASHTKGPDQLQIEKPLLGVPFTVKLLLGVKGMPCNAGSLLHKDVRAYEDADVVTLMKNAGAICLATTNSPEFGLNFETYNSIYGRTSNPYDTRRSAGGSSGGEGAIIGSGGSVIGIGNDFAGSIRHPSNFSGIFGHKPSSEMVSNSGMFPVVTPKLNKTVSTGPMCRYAEDLILLMKVLGGAKTPQMKLDESVDFSKLKMYYMLDINDPLLPKVSEEIQNKILKAVCHFQSTYDIEVKEVNIKKMKLACLIYLHAQMDSVETKVPDMLTAGKCELNPTHEALKALFGQSKINLGALFTLNIEKNPLIFKRRNIPKMLNHLRELQEEFETLLDENSVLILPTFTSAAHYHHELASLLPSLSYMCVFNVLGYPITQCPAGLNRDKLPVGFQVVAAKGEDRLPLACALEFEKLFGGWVSPNISEDD